VGNIENDRFNIRRAVSLFFRVGSTLLLVFVFYIMALMIFKPYTFHYFLEPYIIVSAPLILSIFGFLLGHLIYKAPKFDKAVKISYLVFIILPIIYYISSYLWNEFKDLTNLMEMGIKGLF